MVQRLLLSNAFYRCLVIETEVASVNDVVGLCVARKLIELAQVSCVYDELPFMRYLWLERTLRTSDVCYAKHTSMADLLHTALVGVKRPGSGHRT